MKYELDLIVKDFALALKEVDAQHVQASTSKRTYRPGIGPHSETAAINLALDYLVAHKLHLYGSAGPRKYPSSRKECDLVIPGQWAIEFKVIRPFGDNGKEAEHWSKNVLYPYEGNTGAAGDCMKLLDSNFSERKAVIIFGYEHTPPRIPLEPCIRGFELITEQIVGIDLGPRITFLATDLVHPVHQQALIYGWEVRGYLPN